MQLSLWTAGKISSGISLRGRRKNGEGRGRKHKIPSPLFPPPPPPYTFDACYIGHQISHWEIILVRLFEDWLYFQICHLAGALLLVCTWRHGGHVGCKEQKHFSPLGTKPYFSRKFFEKKIVLTTNIAALSRGCKPRINHVFFNYQSWVIT